MWHTIVTEVSREADGNYHKVFFNEARRTGRRRRRRRRRRNVEDHLMGGRENPSATRLIWFGKAKGMRRSLNGAIPGLIRSMRLQREGGKVESSRQASSDFPAVQRRQYNVQ